MLPKAALFPLHISLNRLLVFSSKSLLSLTSVLHNINDVLDSKDVLMVVLITDLVNIISNMI